VSRVSLVNPDTAPPETADIIRSLHAHGADVHPLLLAVAHSRGCYRNFLRLPDSLIRFSHLDGKLREIAVMRLAQVLDSEYEWALHDRYARAAGVTDEQLEALRAGDIDGGAFDALERDVIAFADSGSKGTLSDELFARVRDRIGEEAVVDLALCVAWWGGLVPVLNSVLDIHLDDR
jgi:alkylhydroperoxidase family enzyme